ncbi:MAG: hypothetical protein P1U41_00285 [Vicingaceae bacterium]|nr:hypothetical protein [Vicingaceae bacterium]
MKQLTYIFFLIFIFGCNNTKSVTVEKSQSISKENATPNIYNCQLIEKEFVNKGGKIAVFKELYLRCSVQDYFIKLCESNLTHEELEQYIGNGISVEVEIKDGMWDHCDENQAHVQSRMGPYAVIKSLK